MNRNGKSIAAAIVISSGLFILLTCFGCSEDSDNASPTPDDLEADSLRCLSLGGDPAGPDGGEFTFEDPRYLSPGVRIEVLPGGLDFMACFKPRVANIPEADYYPSGFQEHVRWRCLDLNPLGAEIYLQAMNMRLSLPVEGISFEPDSSEVLAACYYDGSRDTWAMVLPKAAGDSTMVVESPYRRLWNWGVLNLDEADYEETLKPLLEGIHGHDEWAAIEAEILDLYEQSIPEDWDASCATILALRDEFYSQMMDARTLLLGIQSEIGNDCGPCNVYSGTFLDEALEYIWLRVRQWTWMNLVLEYGINLAGCIAAAQLLYVSDDLARMCDYSCLMPVLRENYPDFWSIYYRYLFNAIGYQLIEFGLESGYYDCG